MKKIYKQKKNFNGGVIFADELIRFSVWKNDIKVNKEIMTYENYLKKKKGEDYKVFDNKMPVDYPVQGHFVNNKLMEMKLIQIKQRVNEE